MRNWPACARMDSARPLSTASFLSVVTRVTGSVSAIVTQRALGRSGSRQVARSLRSCWAIQTCVSILNAQALDGVSAARSAIVGTSNRLASLMTTLLDNVRPTLAQTAQFDGHEVRPGARRYPWRSIRFPLD